MTSPFDWELESRDGELYWEGCRLSELSARFGTPLYVVNARMLEKSVAAFRQAFEAQGLKASIFFSYKTNPVPEVLRRLAALNVGAEVISEGEFELAQRLGLRGERIIVNGSNKTVSFLRLAVRQGAALITVQTAAELAALGRISADLGLPANTGLRINPCLRRRLTDLTISTGTSSSPIGFVRGSKDWEAALSILGQSPGLRFQGLHFHIGSGIRDSSLYREALTKTTGFLDDLLERRLVSRILDIGGGFSISTLREIGLWEAFCLFAWNKHQRPPRPRGTGRMPREVAAVCAQRLRQYGTEGGVPLLSIYLEPGRAISASSQILLLTVRSVIQRGRRRPAAICDGGAMSLSPLLLTEYHSLFIANKIGFLRGKKYDLYGSLPTPLDLVAARRELPDLDPGDLVAVMDTGAYFTSLGNNFAGPRPAIVLIEDGRASLIRRRETWDDLFSRDVSLGGSSLP